MSSKTIGSTNNMTNQQSRLQQCLLHQVAKIKTSEEFIEVSISYSNLESREGKERERGHAG